MNAKKTQKTWRWLRISFSLRSLLLFTFLFAAVLGSWIESAQRQRALLDKIESISEELGLQAQFEFAETWDILKWLPSSIKSDLNYLTRPESLQVRSNGDVITSELMLAIAELHCLRKIEFIELRASHANLSLLADCKVTELRFDNVEFVGNAICQLPTQVERLELTRCTGTYSVFQNLASLTSLKSVDVWNCSITGDGFENICSLRDLEELSIAAGILDRVAFPIQQFESIRKLRKLRKLALHMDCPMTDTTMDSIGSLTLLESVTLPSKTFSAKGLANLASCKKLETLELYGNPTDELTLAGLPTIHSLKTVIFDHWYTPVSSNIIGYLLRLPNLERVEFPDDKYSLEASRKLREMPKFQGISEGGKIGPYEKKIQSLLNGKVDDDYSDVFFIELDGMTDVSEALKNLSRASKLSELRLREADVQDSDLSTIGMIDSLQSLGIPETKVSDSGLVQLSTLKHLDQLQADGLELSFEGLPLLEQLSYLSISGSHLTTDGCFAIGRQPRLRHLIIQNATLNASMMSALAKSTSLERLDLLDCEMEKNALSPLSECSTLSELDLHGSQFDNTSTGLETLDNLHKLNLVETNINDVGTLALGKLALLRELDLNETAISDKTLESLGSMTGLENLRVVRTQCTWNGLKALENLPNLQIVSSAWISPYAEIVTSPLIDKFRDMRFNNDFAKGTGPVTGLSLVTGLLDLTPTRIQCILDAESLKLIDLSGSKVSDHSLTEILRYKKLEKLVLAQTEIGNAGIAALNSYPEMESLDFTQTKVTDEGIAVLATLPKLKKLTLAQTQITNKGLRALRPLATQITELTLTETDIDQDALIELSHWTNLKILHLDGTPIGLAACIDTLSFENLDKFIVNDCELGRSGIDFVLGKGPTPDYLCLKGSYWSDEKVRTLAENRALVAVDFDGLRFTDDMAEVLSSIPHLQVVRWENTSPDASQIKKLQVSRFLRSVEFKNSRLDQSHIDMLASIEHLREIGIAKTDGLERLDWRPLASLPDLDELWIHQCNLDRAFEKELMRTLGERLRVVR